MPTKHLPFMTLPSCLLAFSIAMPAGHAQDAGQPIGTVVHTTNGDVAGLGDGSMHIYKGIPFAKPPIGDLRWRPPQPLTKWAGVRDATEFGPDCMQRPDPRLRGKGMSEDCLYLNVWTPAGNSQAKLPVMVFIYGGALDHGSGSRADFDGELLARKGVVFVNLNYRLGVFGLMAHPLLTAESPHKSSGDYAFLDQIAALQWVHDNIAAFGGDPGRVTIFGQSAGGSSINVLLLSPLAKGLFQGAISESPGEMRALARLSEGEKFGLVVGNNLAAMRAMSAAALLQKNTELKNMRAAGATLPRPLWPVIDGWVLPLSEKTAYATGRVNVVPFITGNNEEETGNGSRRTTSTLAEYQEQVRRTYGASADLILNAYPLPDNPTPAELRLNLANIASDNEYGFGVRANALDMSKLMPNTYRYYFVRHHGDGPSPAVHVDELPYVFGHMDAPPPSGPPAYNDTDRKLSRIMMDEWVSFAATGNPNGSGLPVWPQFNASTNMYLRLDATPKAAVDKNTGKLEALRKAYETNLAASGNAAP